MLNADPLGSLEPGRCYPRAMSVNLVALRGVGG
jgi:hypothetical protein